MWSYILKNSRIKDVIRVNIKLVAPLNAHILVKSPFPSLVRLAVFHEPPLGVNVEDLRVIEYEVEPSVTFITRPFTVQKRPKLVLATTNNLTFTSRFE